MTKISNQYSLTNILTADLANSRLGINNVSPTVALDVTGAGKFSSTLQSNGGFIQANQTEIFASAGASNRAYAFSVGNVAAGDFTISQGSTATGGTYTTRLTINPSGNVGIGTSSPSAAGGAFTGLDIRGSGGGSIILGTTSTPYAYMYGEATGFYIQSAGAPILFLPAGSERMRITSGGTVGIGVVPSNEDPILIVKGRNNTSSGYALILQSSTSNLMLMRNDGYAYIAASAWAYGSDRRIKENISDVANGLDLVSKLKPKHFDYINGAKDNLGFIAQEVQELIPQAVSISDEKTGMLGLKTDFIIPYLVKSIQELSAKVSLLENK